MGRITGKACLVTGAGSGIGRAIAERFAEEGGQVLCVDLNGETAEATVEAIRRRGGVAEAAAADISCRAQIEACVQRCVARWGHIDVLVNNAGVNLPGVFHELEDAQIDRTLDVNVKGAVYASRAAIPHMLRQEHGSIVNIASVNGLVAEPFLALYSASKGAVVMLTRGIALDYAPRGLRCNCICPGWVDTPINDAHIALLGGRAKVEAALGSFQPIGRAGEPREIAHLALFLASDEASFITGSIITADGGFTAQ